MKKLMTNCTEPNRAACPRLCSDYCNAIEEPEACRSAPACSTSSDTPDTDTAEFEVIDDYECGIYVVSSCHARMLEIERDEARQQRDELEESILNLLHAPKCACGEDSTGWVEIKCCNNCGLPHKAENIAWSFSPANAQAQAPPDSGI